MRRGTLLVVALGCGCGLTLAIQAKRLSSAEAETASARGRLLETHQNIDRLESLRRQDERVSLGQKPPQDVITRLRATMATAGVDAGRLIGVQADASASARTTLGGRADRFHTQSVRATLEGVTPIEVGRVLVAWRQSQKLWTTTSLTMTHRGGNDNRYRAELGFSAIYLDEAAP